MSNSIGAANPTELIKALPDNIRTLLSHIAAQDRRIEAMRRALEQLEIIGPHDGVIWLHLRSGKGLVSIRIDEPPMVEAYLDWFAKVKTARAALKEPTDAE